MNISDEIQIFFNSCEAKILEQAKEKGTYSKAIRFLHAQQDKVSGTNKTSQNFAWSLYDTVIDKLKHEALGQEIGSDK
ncbi:hypothetical protein [Liquorilactobacillus satsumensis]|uniref:hypothetical protein n=1 Tax=Liquorilactobacillus TaxID=2767888 RepID=UPI0021C48019|nr:hypothetical protein [Liquorilactobacillus satsumensis]MCP9313837.1 hypothetical protein [Liquorilactobacillus satsumensis]MCP9360978.1 hypothetical protein [Liquorilactobacillus satsumensis]